MSRFCRFARDYERLPETLAGLHFVAFVILMLKNVAEILLKVDNRLKQRATRRLWLRHRGARLNTLNG